MKHLNLLVIVTLLGLSNINNVSAGPVLLAAKDKNIEHLCRDGLTTKEKSALIYHFTENDEAETKVEKAFIVCNNDDEKHVYLNLVLASYMYKLGIRI